MFSELLSSFRFLFDTKAGDERVMARVAEEQRIRLAEMAKDPLRKKYVAKIEAGAYWFDEDITYNVDVNATNVCEHLRPVERLMRTQEIDLRKATVNRSRAYCLVDFEKLKRELPLADSIVYTEPHIPDRSILDPRSAIIWCTIESCASSIFAVHTDEGKLDVPTFPR